MAHGLRAQLRDQLRVVAERELGLRVRFEHLQATVLQRRRLRAYPRLVREPGQRRSAPQRERFARHVTRRLPLSVLESSSSGRRELCELGRVEAIARPRKPEPTCRRFDDVALGAGRTEPCTEPRDIRLDRTGCARRRVLGPQCVDDLGA